MKIDRDRFWTLLEPEHSRAEAFCRKLMGARDDGDDLYQEALLTAMLKFDSLRDEASFRPWLYRIVVNTHKNRLRRPWWRRLVPLERDLVESRATDHPEDGFSAKRWLERAFRALSAPEKALITLFELESWSVAELSELYRAPEGTIKARLSRARRKMRREIERYLPENTTEHRLNEADYALPQKKPSGE